MALCWGSDEVWEVRLGGSNAKGEEGTEMR